VTALADASRTAVERIVVSGLEDVVRDSDRRSRATYVALAEDAAASSGDVAPSWTRDEVHDRG
jgi:hypothetical protein